MWLMGTSGQVYRIDWIFSRLSGRKLENPIAFGEYWEYKSIIMHKTDDISIKII
jgi:hypothetical protein